ncbi:MAG: hypothetical protein GF383_13405 [Candidatus Lokiarchaeota archaeon]|nr:hypothetical protein [Candidatus Lokiarchaeota archaeon]MBD3342194.1 hypothetical protein [Candidatus Lokiarchaeota archaeon]
MSSVSLNRKIKFNFLILFVFFLTWLTTYSIPLRNETQEFGLALTDHEKEKNLKLSTYDPPIFINNNSAFKNIYGFDGEGTFSSPYLIEDLEIKAREDGNCIFINNTNCYWKIQNCSLFKTDFTESNQAIRLENVTNGLIYDNNITYAPIFVLSSRNITINYNMIQELNTSILLSNSNNCTIIRNTIHNCEYINLIHSHNNSIIDNIIKKCENVGILALSSNNTLIKNNDISECKRYGIELTNSSYTEILNNYIYDYGINHTKIDEDSLGTINEGNIYSPPPGGETTQTLDGDDDDDDDDFSALEFDATLFGVIFLISIISSSLGFILFIIVHRRLRKKKQEQEELKEQNPSELELNF